MRSFSIIAIFLIGLLGACHTSQSVIRTTFAEYKRRVEVPPAFFGDNVPECSEDKSFSEEWLGVLNQSGRKKFFLKVVCGPGGVNYYIYGTRLVTDRYFVVVTRNHRTASYIFEYSAA